jgi:hypothetical protein
MKCTQAVKNFLLAQAQENPQLADIAAWYSGDMETQINAAQDGGEEIQRKTVGGRPFRLYTDGLTEWGMRRIPKNAATVPEDNDYPIKWNLEEHAEAIGSTGWDWKNQRSLWLGYDFDSIVGHKEGITEAEMEQVRESASAIPWITVRKSTSGRGLHLYVMLGTFEDGVWSGGVPTANHHEHAALARAILGKMSAIADFDFSTKIDVCGGNMWMWARKLIGTDGLTVLKMGTVLSQIPPNWKDHLNVIKGKRRRAAAAFVDDGDIDVFEELSGTHTQIQLDDTHRKLILHLEGSGGMSWWDSDRHMLVCHTYDLKCAHEVLDMRGIFETSAQGKERGADQNCFAFPTAYGGWVVRRHTPGVSEANTWDQDGSGWTRCYLNVDPDINTASRRHEAVETVKGGWVFDNAETALLALQDMGVHANIGQLFLSRPCTIREHKDGRLIVEIDWNANDPGDQMRGWAQDKKKWVRIFQPKVSRTAGPLESESLGADKLIRHLVDVGNESAGWVVRATQGEWQGNPLTQVKFALEAAGYTAAEVKKIIGTHVFEGWKLVNRPFQSEYPGNREWNRNAAQMRFTPSESSDELSHPDWTSILDHIGSGLDEAVQNNAWCNANGIRTGAEWLTLWIASLFRNPDQPLPYLFLYSPEQDSGKSTLFEAISLLMTSGYCSAEQALTNDSGFNGELAGCVLAFIDEFNVAKSKQAYERVKNWVTARLISIRRMYHQPYMAVNTTHWIQCANDKDFCPIFAGDTRITVIRVPPIDPIDMKPKQQLMDDLEKQAPDFLRMLLDTEIPDSKSRLKVVCLSSAEKLALEDRNKSPLQKFIEEHCHQVNGSTVDYGEFYDRFKLWISDPLEANNWSKKKVTSSLDLNNPVAKLSSHPTKRWIGNLAWRIDKDGTEQPKPETQVRLVKDGYKLSPQVS